MTPLTISEEAQRHLNRMRRSHDHDRRAAASLEALLAENATLKAQAEPSAAEIERLRAVEAERDMYRVTLQNLRRASRNMLTGVAVHNALHKDSLARQADIAGPVVTSLKAAEMSAGLALEPNPPTGYIATAEAGEG